MRLRNLPKPRSEAQVPIWSLAACEKGLTLRCFVVGERRRTGAFPRKTGLWSRCNFLPVSKSREIRDRQEH